MSTSQQSLEWTYGVRKVSKPLRDQILQLTDFSKMNKNRQLQTDVSPERVTRPLDQSVDNDRFDQDMQLKKLSGEP